MYILFRGRAGGYGVAETNQAVSETNYSKLSSPSYISIIFFFQSNSFKAPFPRDEKDEFFLSLLSPLPFPFLPPLSSSHHQSPPSPSNSPSFSTFLSLSLIPRPVFSSITPPPSSPYPPNSSCGQGVQVLDVAKKVFWGVGPCGCRTWSQKKKKLRSVTLNLGCRTAIVSDEIAGMALMQAVHGGFLCQALVVSADGWNNGSISRHTSR